MMPFNPNGASWRQWAKVFNERIEIARTSMERAGLDPVTTEGLRGEITALRSLLELGTPAQDSAGAEAPVNYGLSRKN